MGPEHRDLSVQRIADVVYHDDPAQGSTGTLPCPAGALCDGLAQLPEDLFDLFFGDPALVEQDSTGQPVFSSLDVVLDLVGQGILHLIDRGKSLAHGDRTEALEELPGVAAVVLSSSPLFHGFLKTLSSVTDAFKDSTAVVPFQAVGIRFSYHSGPFVDAGFREDGHTPDAAPVAALRAGQKRPPQPRRP